MTAALAQARERHQLHLEHTAPGSIVLGGITYHGGGLYLGPLKEEYSPSGNWRPAQRMILHIRKARLATPPAKRTSFTCRDLTFGVDEVAGQSPDAIAWIIKGIRWPDSPS